eukprot:PhF_6_TR17441/c0_g1_i1/m.26688
MSEAGSQASYDSSIVELKQNMRFWRRATTVLSIFVVVLIILVAAWCGFYTYCRSGTVALTGITFSSAAIPSLNSSVSTVPYTMNVFAHNPTRSQLLFGALTIALTFSVHDSPFTYSTKEMYLNSSLTDVVLESGFRDTVPIEMSAIFDGGAGRRVLSMITSGCVVISARGGITYTVGNVATYHKELSLRQQLFQTG